MTSKRKQEAHSACRQSATTVEELRQMKKHRAEKPAKPSALVKVNNVIRIQKSVFVVERQIGQGTYSRCFKAKSSAGCFAIKVQNTVECSENARKRHVTEIKIHTFASSHPHIVSLLATERDTHNLYIQLELCQRGDLHGYVHNNRGCSKIVAITIMCQLSHATAFLHSQGILHRDIKLANVFLDSKGSVKLGDFGLAVLLATNEDYRPGRVGTPAYMAPELIQEPGFSSYASDVWALGVVMFALINIKLPFEAETSGEVQALVVHGRYRFGPRMTSCRYKDLVKSVLVSCYNERPSARALYRDCSLLRREYLSEAQALGCSPQKKVHKTGLPKFLT